MYLKWMLLYYKQRFDYVRRVITMMNLKQTSINVAKRQQSVGIFIIGVSVRITHKIRGGKKGDVCVTKVTIIPPPTPAMLHVSCPNQPISIDPCASLCAVNAVWMRGWWGGWADGRDSTEGRGDEQVVRPEDGVRQEWYFRTPHGSSCGGFHLPLDTSITLMTRASFR